LLRSSNSSRKVQRKLRTRGAGVTDHTLLDGYPVTTRRGNSPAHNSLSFRRRLGWGHSLTMTVGAGSATKKLLHGGKTGSPSTCKGMTPPYPPL